MLSRYRDWKIFFWTWGQIVKFCEVDVQDGQAKWYQYQSSISEVREDDLLLCSIKVIFCSAKLYFTHTSPTHLSRPRSTALVCPHTLADPDNLLVLCVLLLDVVHDEPPLEVGVTGSARPYEGLHELTGRSGGLLEQTRLSMTVSVVVSVVGLRLGVLFQQVPQRMTAV